MKIDDLIYFDDYFYQSILSQGRILDYDFVIVSNGTHPCCYVGKFNLFNRINADFLEEKICVHGGITYRSDNFFGTLSFLDKKLNWIGWDYAHGGDCYSFKNINKGRKWTMKELYEDCCNVVEQLIDLYEKELKEKR